jgi:hypothetical protein
MGVEVGLEVDMGKVRGMINEQAASAETVE